jgi:hypothetical protein
LNKLASFFLALVLPAILGAQQPAPTPQPTAKPVTTYATTRNTIPLSIANGVIGDSNLWNVRVFPNGEVGMGSDGFGGMAFAPDNADFAGGSLFHQAGPQLHFRLSRAYCDKTSATRQSVDDQQKYFCVPDAVTIDDAHPSNTRPNKNFVIAPYKYGMGITYPGIVEFAVATLSVHAGGFGPANFWVGDEHDLGGILISAHDARNPDGTLDRSQSFSSLTSQSFDGSSHGDILFTVRDPQDSIRFQFGPAGIAEGPGTYPQYTKAKIDSTGTGFFDGGTQTTGADFAESVSVAGPKRNYEPGDVLMISTDSDRQVTLANAPYSTLVAGIYSTKPGVLATLHTSDDPRIAEEVPVAIVGIVPCKVTNENGPIHRGDLLVSSSTPGHAMRGSEASIRSGTVIGKALQNFSGVKGKIEVLVMPR